jgi:hypothetical protein
VYIILLTTGFGHGWGTVQTVNAVPDWRGDIMEILGVKMWNDVKWWGFVYMVRPLFTLKTAE